MSPSLAVTSPSFSRHPVLGPETCRRYPAARLNLAGDRLSESGLAAFVGDATALIVGLERIDETLLAACPGLRYVAKYGVGLDNIDFDACARRQVRVGYRAGVNAGAVAELALALAIGFRRNLFREARNMAGGIWHKDGGFGLSETCVGIIGLGHVGRAFTRLLRAAGARVLATDIVDIDDWCAAHGVAAVTPAALLQEAQIVSLHVPLTERTRFMVDAAFLARMRADAVLINTARGDVVDLDALLAALQSGRIAGAALDVFDVEPPHRPELLAHPGIVATPHIAGNSNEAVLAMGRAALDALDELLSQDAKASDPRRQAAEARS
ncbi:NAD(P)-dependent oxidoreductase [Marinibaculum pumilum]|uniref:NAD(P)-dependent oxidoreductase n=1 Tax=Marinibaculum pumilum TaxID=1766165 RepID=A0ABV7L2M6_9PROT